MRVLTFSLMFLLLVFSSCKKDEVADKIYSPTVIGSWEIVQTATTHELGHYGPYDPPVRDVDSRVTTTVDHQDKFETLDVSSASLTWTDLESASRMYNWEYENDIFTLTGTDTTLAYRVTELTSDTFVFFIKDHRVYNDSSNLVAYEEYQYVYHLSRLNN